MLLLNILFCIQRQDRIVIFLLDRLMHIVIRHMMKVDRHHMHEGRHFDDIDRIQL